MDDNAICRGYRYYVCPNLYWYKYNNLLDISNEFTSKEQKNYDIRDILNKAKDKKPIEDTPRSLDNTNYNILKNLRLNRLGNRIGKLEFTMIKKLVLHFQANIRQELSLPIEFCLLQCHQVDF